ncbi:MAG: hypothetical protein ACKVHQ_06655 [Gammaproteobacteria bacterium]|jgi:cytoskeletal protein RodZ
MKTNLKFKNCWLPLQNMRLTFALITLFACTSLISIKVNAYDGDVDFMAPYLTVDPETGKLVTIDPRAQTKTEHESTTDATTQIPSTTVDAPTSQIVPVSAQNAQENTSIPSTGQTETAPGSKMPVIAFAIIGLLAFSFFLYSKQKKPVVNSETDAGNS